MQNKYEPLENNDNKLNYIAPLPYSKVDDIVSLLGKIKFNIHFNL
jgi:hypothetical protein